MRYVFIINPCAGKKDSSKELIEKINNVLKESNKEYKTILTEYNGHATEIARSEAEIGDEVTIFACGGDGTNSEVLNGVVGFENVTLGFIPIGTGNDYIKYYGEANEFLNIENQILGSAKFVDLINVDNERYSLNVCNCGMDAIVADNMNIFKKFKISGKLAYNLALAYTFFSKLGTNFDIQIDDNKPINKDCMFVVCANSKVYGGGFKCAPTAVPYDGALEYCVIDKISHLRILSLIGIYSRGEHLGLDVVSYGQCQKMKISTKDGMPVSVDGEILHKKEVNLEIVKNAIKIHLPKSVVEKFKFEPIKEKLNKV